jgi:RimJ/RimL family protein N-acetyltransferase
VTGPNTITCDRIILREAPISEMAEILAGGKPEGQNWSEGYPFEGTIGGAKLLVRMAENNVHRAGFGLYQITEGESSLVIGDIGFHSAPGDDGSVEIGYGLVESHRRRGYATEAARALVAWALQQPGVTEVRAETDAGHLPSQGVLLNSGFTLAGSDETTRRYVRRRSGGAPE